MNQKEAERADIISRYERRINELNKNINWIRERDEGDDYQVLQTLFGNSNQLKFQPIEEIAYYTDKKQISDAKLLELLQKAMNLRTRDILREHIITFIEYIEDNKWIVLTVRVKREFSPLMEAHMVAYNLEDDFDTYLLNEFEIDKVKLVKKYTEEQELGSFRFMHEDIYFEGDFIFYSTFYKVLE
jgi:hypothetical protein